VLLDAGTAASKLTLREQQAIRYVLLSHLHFDHIKGLPTLADNLSEDSVTPVVIGGIEPVMEGLHRHIFNGEVYPDFFRLPSPDRPALVAQLCKPGTTYEMAGVRVEPVLVNHTVPTTGFLVQNDTSAFVYSGDTYSTEELWVKAGHLPHLRAVFIECSYPDSLGDLARLSRHLTPSLVAEEIRKLNRQDVALYAYHLKPAYRKQIIGELQALGIPRLHVLEEGEVLEI
jgi:ribonuclease BN (tRNA processing enzyme)